MLIGSVVLVVLGLAGALPAVAGLFIRMYQGIATGSVGSLRFWDSLAVGTAVLAQFAFLAVLQVRARRRLPARSPGGSARLALSPASPFPEPRFFRRRTPLEPRDD